MDPLNPQPNTVPTPMQPAPPVPKKSHTVLWISIVVFALVIAAGSFFLWQENKKMDQELAQISNNTEVKVDPMAGWKTYTNEEYGFEIKIPQDWSVDDKTPGKVVVGEFIDFVSSKTLKNYEDWKKSPESCSECDGGPLPVDIYFSTFSGGKDKDLGQVTLGNISWDKYLQYDFSATLHYSFLKDNKTYHFGVIGDSKEEEMLLEQILSTFKFTEPAVTETKPSGIESVSGWKTYTDIQYGFTFNYPSDWPVKNALPKDRTDGTITVGDSTGADDIKNYPKCFLELKIQFSGNSIIPAPYKRNYYNNISEGTACEATLKKIIDSFKFTN